MHQQKMKVLQYHMILQVNSGQLDINTKLSFGFFNNLRKQEDGLYGSVASRYTKALARSMKKVQLKKLKQQPF